MKTTKKAIGTLATVMLSAVSEEAAVANMATIVRDAAVGAKNQFAACLSTIKSRMAIPAASRLPERVMESMRVELAKLGGAMLTGGHHAGAASTSQTSGHKVLAKGLDLSGVAEIVGTRTTISIHSMSPEQQMTTAKEAYESIKDSAKKLSEKSAKSVTTDDRLRDMARARALVKRLGTYEKWLGKPPLKFFGNVGEDIVRSNREAAVAYAKHKALEAAAEAEIEATKELTTGATVGKRKVGRGKSHSVAKLDKRQSSLVKAQILRDGKHNSAKKKSAKKLAIAEAKRALAAALAS